MKMDKRVGKLVALFVVTGFTAILGAPTESQAANFATGNSSAYIVKPIAIGTPTKALDFGKFLVGTGGTVKVDTDDTLTMDGPLSFGSQGGAVTAASFPVSGENSASFGIVMPATTTLNGTGGTTGSMTVDLTSNPATTGTLASDGTLTLRVGGTLHVAADQAVGNYSGTFGVTVNYN